MFVTTLDFSKEARDFTKSIGTKIILIDGQRLAQLMLEFDVGVSKNGRYEIKQVDTDYFES